ncbi:trypsin-like peptidase domain-containing protein [Kribbella solani]|uniref:trypsin-like peptidase domain-containing protein n=2 Tax=Kribbella solani TaxID=236067 RepID=UPI0029B00A6B|nr:trypsin-like peptidase domain-containing protein [Kribbella solani]MDX2973442.1 trypsin-like peptidase domain-containing protein [Kribbella solani]
MTEVDGHRVAEVIVTMAGGVERRGSGYLIRQGLVLTATHVIAAARSIRVRFDADHIPGEWSASGEVVWSAGDLAVLAITPAGDPVPIARFGGIGDRAASLHVRAVGFPWFKLRTESDHASYRDTHQADGTLATLSNRREGTLEVTVSPPAADPDPRRSPWDGMSGAALFSGDRIIGVLAEHHRSEGLGRLSAVRFDEGIRTELADLLGVRPAAPDILRSPHERTRHARLLTLSNTIAPDQLLDRTEELAELAAFCASDEPCLWWQADPWAGKSALLSWFVLHPPPGVEVVSFFVTRRLPGQSDSDAYLSAILPQLLPGSDEPDRFQALAVAYESAAARAAEVGQRLVLVVDGLDEDTGSDLSRPSIASLLPRRVPPNLRIILTSRTDLPIPADVRTDHPLRTYQVRQLSPSPHAVDLEREATNELVRVLRGPDRPVIGLLAASGGGLNKDDLAELTGRSRFDIAEQLAGVLGRSVRLTEAGYVFSHDALRATAEEQLGAEIAQRRRELRAWAETYQQRHWPESTPDYLLRTYPHLLAAVGDLDGLLWCADDNERHDRLRARTGADQLALSELFLAHRLNTMQPLPDFTVAMRLAVRRADLAAQYAGMPACLPAVLELLGEPTLAEALAYSVTDSRPRALVELAQVVADSGLDRAWSPSRVPVTSRRSDR